MSQPLPPSIRRTEAHIRWGFLLGIRISLMVLSVGCGDDQPLGSGGSTVTVTVAPAADTLRTGDSVLLVATVRDTSGQIVTGLPIAWVSDSPAVASVASTGWVVTIQPGTATIRATVEGRSGTSQVSVFPLLDLTGLWDYVQAVTDTELGITCADTGSVRVTQLGSSIDGSAETAGVCTNQVVSSFGTGNVTGQVVLNRITFETRYCYFMSVSELADPDSLGGTVSCYTGPQDWEGTWSARRGGPVASVSLVPPNRHLVPGGWARLDAVLRDGRGARVFGRTPAWSSDNDAVASVTPDGVVTGHTSGSATITAVVDGQSAVASVSVATVRFTELRAGYGHVCAIAADRVCWGDNRYGALGDGTDVPSAAPLRMPDGITYTDLTTGGMHTCAFTSAGAVCWGYNAYGQIGDGSTTTRRGPVPVSAAASFTAIAAGAFHTCALRADGSAWCWGDNTSNQLGRSDTPPFITSSPTPIAVDGGHAFVSLFAGGRHTCGLTAVGEAYCWGANEVRQLGVDSLTSNAPVGPVGGATFQSLALGSVHTCGITTGGATLCWGNNEWGQLGSGLTSYFGSPTPVSGGVTFASLSAGDDYTCGIDGTGAAYCWGRSGPWLGIGPTSPNTATAAPAPVLGGLSFTSVTAGGGHACGLTTAGVAYCWGYYSLGIGSFASSDTPVKVIGQP